MTAILAIETSTDACSVAIFSRGTYRQFHEVVPRQHNQRLFALLSELLPRGSLRDAGIECLAYGCGPGSFTGLRIAASAVQGLAYASSLPVVPVSTLACQAATALRHGLVDGGRPVLSTLAARANEIYWSLVFFEDGRPVTRAGPLACSPDQLSFDVQVEGLDLVGTGARYLGEFPKSLRDRVAVADQDLLPEARDLVPLAQASFACGKVQEPRQVIPVYVRDEISWKKLSEQGSQS